MPNDESSGNDALTAITDEATATATASSDIESDTGGWITLPWWQRPVNILVLLVTVALVAGMAGWLVRDTTADRNASEVDVGFLWDMRLHHEQAVQMGFIYLDLPDADWRLRDVASGIVMGQSIEIGRMVQMLQGFGEELARDMDDDTMGWMGMASSPSSMPGMATRDEIDRLQQAEGRDADELFVELMSRHHVGGIDMADYAAEHGRDGDVRVMARAMADSQAREIIEMQDILDT